MDVTETLLPGVGMRYEFVTATGTRLGVIVRRAGQVEMVVYDRDDPDACTPVMTLTRAEADTVAELLGAPRIAERFADLTREVPGLVAAQLSLRGDSAFVGRPLGDTRLRTLTGASVVAVVRDSDVVAAPHPDEVLRADDVLVVMGTDEGIDAARRILEQPAAG